MHSEIQREPENDSDKMRAVLDTVIDAIITIDSFGKITQFNPAAELIFGYTPSEILGKNIKILMPDPHQEAHDGYIKRYQTEGFSRLLGKRRELTARRKNGEIFPIELGINSFRASGEELFVGSIRDISERKVIENKIEEYTHDLEIARLQADSANKMKSEFLAMMSHEIRTPMNGIIGMADLLLESSPTNKQAGYLRTLLSSAEALLTIINDILDFSKIEAGRLTLDPIPLDLRALAEETAHLMTPRARDKGLELIIRMPPSTPSYLIGDPTRIRQILANLVGNAIKFTESGYVMLTVEEDTDLSQRTGKSGIKVSVKDTGIGIPKEAQTHLFQKFMQADASTTRKFGGTGLGLAICKKLVEMMEGTIKVESTLGEGACFSFSMALEKDPERSESLLSQKTTLDLQNSRILLVDDVSFNTLAMSEHFEALGIFTESHTTGTTAFEALRKGMSDGQPFDILITDYIMPEMDGLQLAQQIKKHPALQNTIIIGVTSAATRMNAETFQDSGFSGILSKPFKMDDILQAVQLCLCARAEGSAIFITNDDLLSLGTANSKIDEPQLNSVEVLLTEDNIVNQSFATEVLEKAGCRVTIAQNGKEAVTLFSKKKYDLIFMDCEMPIMDGYEATKEIRALENKNAAVKTTIIALTASAMLGDKEKCRASGMDDYLSKPIRKDQLLACISKNIPPSLAPSAPIRNKEKQFLGLRALLVDDNRTNLDLTAKMLEDMGLTVTLSQNGKEAVDAAKNSSFDVIFLDCQMPVMDGYEAAGHLRQIRAERKREGMPIIALTANAQKSDREKCLAAGMDDYLSKPVRKKDLHDALARWFEKQEIASYIPGDDLLDLEIFETAREMMQDNFPAWVDRFIKNAKNSIQALEIACSQKDLNTLRSSAKSLRASSAFLGALRLSGIAGQIALENEDLFQEGLNTEKIEALKNTLRLTEQSLNRHTKANT